MREFYSVFFLDVYVLPRRTELRGLYVDNSVLIELVIFAAPTLCRIAVRARLESFASDCLGL
jgi:hypothetical protein